MRVDHSFDRAVGIFGLLTTIFMLGNGVTIFMLSPNPEALFNDPSALLSLGSSSVGLFHVSMVLDVLGYLSLAPLVIFCATRLMHGREGWVSLVAFCGLSYSLLGSVGAVVTDAVITNLMTGYAHASSADQATMRLLAGALNQAVTHGIWNPLEVLMVSLFFLGVGLMLRPQSRALAVVAIILGCVALLDPIGWIIGSLPVQTIGAGGDVLIPIWTAWFGIELLRKPDWLRPTTGSTQAEQSSLPA